MKDFLNFDITAKNEGRAVRYTMQHRVRASCAMSFNVPGGAIGAQHIPDFLYNVMKGWVHKYIKATRKNLTPKQKKFYDALVWFHQEENRPPSYQEICEILDYKSKGTVTNFVGKLIEAGWLWKDEEGRVIPVDIAAPELTE